MRADFEFHFSDLPDPRVNRRKVYPLLEIIFLVVEYWNVEPVSDQIVKLLTPFKDKVFTVTADNGSEFAYHESISKKLKAAMYFAHPYHSWERGLNENTNGLIRQYIPKGSDFNEVSQIQIDQIVGHLNSRPRKSLDYATPNEIFGSIK